MFHVSLKLLKILYIYIYIKFNFTYRVIKRPPKSFRLAYYASQNGRDAPSSAVGKAYNITNKHTVSDFKIIAQDYFKKSTKYTR